MKLHFRLTVADVAELYSRRTGKEITSRQMKAHLERLNEELGGMLLIPSRGANRRYTVSLAALKRADPDAFAVVENLESRIDLIEDLQKQEVARTNTVVRHVTRLEKDVSFLKNRRRTSTSVDSRSG
jgi:CII-binding regulator of phage lambda lysogenization HflD